MPPYFEAFTPLSRAGPITTSAAERFGFAGEAAADPENIGRSALDNVFGYVTDHDIRFETRVRQFVPENRRFLICNGSLALTGAFIGCNGITTAFSNIWPEALHKILTLGMAGECEGARACSAACRK